MQNLGGQNFEFSKNVILTFLDEFGRIREKEKEIQKISQIQNFDPLIFETL